MAAPVVRSVGVAVDNANAISPGLPSGAVEGDLLIMILETRAQAITVTDWAEAPSSPQTSTGSNKSRLTIFYIIETAVGVNRTTSDSGNHQIGQIIAIQAGTFNSTTPFNVAAGGIQLAVTAVSVILAVTTGHIPDADGTTEFSGWTNADLSAVTERMDKTGNAGDGGAIACATGVKAAAGAYGATTATAVTTANRGVISLAIAPTAVTDTRFIRSSLVSRKPLKTDDDRLASQGLISAGKST